MTCKICLHDLVLKVRIHTSYVHVNLHVNLHINTKDLAKPLFNFFFNLFLEKHKLVNLTVVKTILLSTVLQIKMMFWMCLIFMLRE